MEYTSAMSLSREEKKEGAEQNVKIHYQLWRGGNKGENAYESDCPTYTQISSEGKTETKAYWQLPRERAGRLGHWS